MSRFYSCIHCLEVAEFNEPRLPFDCLFCRMQTVWQPVQNFDASEVSRDSEGVPAREQ